MRKPNRRNESRGHVEQDKIELKRTKAIGRIVATTGIAATMSGEWKKPILESALLPAHAFPSYCPETRWDRWGTSSRNKGE